MVRAVTPIPFVKARFFDRCGKPLAGGKVYTYEANTTTDKTTYKDPYGLTPNTNPIILDAAGEADIYLDGTYRIRITDRNGVLVNDVAKIGSWFSDNLQDSLDNVSSAMGEALKPTLQNLNDTVDAAQVEVNRRVFLLDGAIATAAAAGAGANGWTALLVESDGLNQQQINDGLPTIAELASIENPRNGQRVYVKSYHAGLNKGGGTFIYNSSKASQNDSGSVINGWVRQFESIVTPFMFGAKADGSTDDTLALTRALKFARENGLVCDGLRKTYQCCGVLFDNNQKFYRATLVCNKFDTDIISVLESTSYNNDPRWLENIDFQEIYIEGNRQLHTNIKKNTGQEDGGRHGFRFIRPTRHVRMKKCKGLNCATDGITFFPHGGSKPNQVLDVELEDCEFSGNRRHGGSSDSVNGIKFTRVICNNNGLDIDPSAATNSGLRGDTVSSGVYGSGWDCEEYGADIVSTNMQFIDCEMLKNARSGLLVLTTGNTSEAAEKAVIHIKGGAYDAGVSVNADGQSILVTPLYHKDVRNTVLFTVDDVNLSNGIVAARCVDRFETSNLLSAQPVGVFENTTAYVDDPSNVYIDATSGKSAAYFRFMPNVDSFSYKNDELKLKSVSGKMKLTGNIIDTAAGELRISAFRSFERGALSLAMNVNTGGCDLIYSGANGEKLIIIDSGNYIYPATSARYFLGSASKRFNTVFLTNAPNVESDERIKKDIRALNDAEKLVAKDLKAEICVYRLKDNDSKLQIGMIAQKVVAIFEKYGLNALEYQVVYYDADIDRYSIVYEQLTLFVLSAI